MLDQGIQRTYASHWPRRSDQLFGFRSTLREWASIILIQDFERQIAAGSAPLGHELDNRVLPCSESIFITVATLEPKKQGRHDAVPSIAQDNPIWDLAWFGEQGLRQVLWQHI